MSPIQWPGKITMPMGGADADDFAKRWEETFGPRATCFQCKGADTREIRPGVWLCNDCQADDRVPDRFCDPIGIIGCDAKSCRCFCPEGECEHKWDGAWWESEDGLESSVTCSVCGTVRMFHDMRVGP
jgi:hypothetical protein